MNSFDENLWERLVDEHDADLVALDSARKRGSRRPFVLGTGVVAGAAAAAVIALNAATSAPPAFALTLNADGSVSVTITELATAVPQLNAKFAATSRPERRACARPSSCPAAGWRSGKGP